MQAAQVDTSKGQRKGRDAERIIPILRVVERVNSQTIMLLLLLEGHRRGRQVHACQRAPGVWGPGFVGLLRTALLSPCLCLPTCM